MVVPVGPRGLDLRAGLRRLRDEGVRSLLVEGGAGVITSFLTEGLAHRLIVAIAPTVIGAGTEAVGDLGVTRVSEGLRLVNRSVHTVGADVVLAADVAPSLEREGTRRARPFSERSARG